ESEVFGGAGGPPAQIASSRHHAFLETARMAREMDTVEISHHAADLADSWPVLRLRGARAGVHVPDRDVPLRSLPDLHRAGGHLSVLRPERAFGLLESLRAGVPRDRQFGRDTVCGTRTQPVSVGRQPRWSGISWPRAGRGHRDLLPMARKTSRKT